MTRLLMLTLLVVAGSASAAGAEFFVSPAGQDTNPGTSDKPFATLERARDAARQLRAADDKSKAPDRQWLVYAHSPLGGRKAVGVTIPAYQQIAIDVPAAGAFYRIDEAKGTAEQRQR